MSYLTKKYLKRALKKLISLKNYKDFEFIVTLYIYTINVIRYLTFGCPSAKPEDVSNIRVYKYLNPSILACSKQNIDWLNTFHLHSFPSEPGPT